MSGIKTFFHYLGAPFVFISFAWKYWRIKAKYKKYKNNPSSYPIEERYYAVYKLAKRVLYLKYPRVHTTGFSKIPSTPGLYITNHKSSLDPVIMFVHLYENNKIPYFRFIAKKEEDTKSHASCAFKLIDTIFIDRSDFRKTFEQYAQIKPLEDKRSVFLFIEGTRVYEPGKLGEFHAGSLRLAYNNCIPVVPFVIWGTSGMMGGDLDHKHKSKGKQVYINCLGKYNPGEFITMNPVHFTNQLQDQMGEELKRIDDLVNKEKNKRVKDPTIIFNKLDEVDEGKRY